MRNTMQLGESINTYDPGVALSGEYGTFKVTTPGGEELFITCKPGDSVPNIQWPDTGNGNNKGYFLVTKISEPAKHLGHTALREVG